MHAVSNRAGNFMFEAEEGEDGTRVRVRDDGKTKLSFWPTFPIEVWIEQGGIEQRMLAPIQREGSCAACHDGGATFSDVEMPPGSSGPRGHDDQRVGRCTECHRVHARSGG